MNTLYHYQAVRIACCCLIACMLLMLGGCSSLKVVESFSKPAKQAHAYKKILILGIAKDENIRKIFENIVVEELGKHQVAAVASHTIIPDLDKTNRDGIIAAVQTAGCDAVLTTRAISAGESSVTQPGHGGSIYGLSPLTTYGGFRKALLQANLFDAKTEELMWSSTVKTVDAEREAHVSRELSRFYFETLRRDGLI